MYIYILVSGFQTVTAMEPNQENRLYLENPIFLNYHKPN